MNNRSVGRPSNDRARMEPRDVPVAHDKPRLNDQRKVSPHAAGDPRMGIRPSGGAQKSTRAPRDALNKSYIQARDVSMEKVTEAELAELNNPFARFFKSKRDFIPGDAVGYQVTRQGIDLYHIKDGYQIGPSTRMDSYETMSRKLEDMKQQYADLKQQRRELSINPKRAAMRLGKDFARQQGFMPTKIGELNTEIPSQQNGPAHGPPASAAPGKPAAGPTASPSAPASSAAAPTGASGPYNMNMSGKSSMVGGAPSYSSGGSFSQKMNGGGTPPTGSAPTNKPFTPPPGAGPANGPGSNGSAAPRRTDDAARPTGPNANEMRIFLYTHAPEMFPPESLNPSRVKDHDVAAMFNAFMRGKQTPMMKKNLAAHQLKTGSSGTPSAPRMESMSGVRMATPGELGALQKEFDDARARPRKPTHPRKDHPYFRQEDLDSAVDSARVTGPRGRTAEAYPDYSFETDEPSHESKLRGNFYWTHKPSNPGTPDLNREFAEFRDLHVEKVTEIAEREIDDFLGRMVSRMGLPPLQEADEDESDENSFEHWKGRMGKDDDDEHEAQTESRIARTRARWIGEKKALPGNLVGSGKDFRPKPGVNHSRKQPGKLMGSGKALKVKPGFVG